MSNIEITNPDKILFPKDKIKKIDVVSYYIDVSPLMMPHIKNRILSVIRCHDNINGECFFKKHPSTERDFVQTLEIDGEEYFYINDSLGLCYQVQNGTIEFHVGGSENNKNPNVMVFDLDPDEKLSLKKLREATKKVKATIEELGLECFLKTSGGKGYHIVLPFKSSKSWKGFYDFSKQIALLIESKWPKEFTTNLKKAERKGKIFIDYLRNNKGSTCACAYSLRAREGAPISMPISWDDLDKISPSEINIKNYKKYLNNSWEKFFEINQKLK